MQPRNSPNLLMNIFKKIRHPLYYQKILIFCYEIKQNSKSFQAKLPIWIGYASLDEINDLFRDQEMDLKVYSWEHLKKKVEDGTWKCIIARYNNQIVAYAFYSNIEMIFAGSTKIEFKLPEYSGYGFREFVRPKYRNKNIHKAINTFRSRLAAKNGGHKVFVAINHTNNIAIHNQKKLGSRLVGSVTFIKTRFFHKVFLSKSIYKTGLRIKKIDE